MNGTEEPFFLFLGDADRESATSSLKSSGLSYVKKMLGSSPQNWEKIVSILKSPNLVGVVMKLNTPAAIKLFSKQYSRPAQELLSFLPHVRHAIFVHENILTGNQTPLMGREYTTDSEGKLLIREGPFPDLSDEDRGKLRELLTADSLNFFVYKTNAELSISTTRFLQENDKRLLFRIYLPKERLWANEADKLLGMFRDWLSKVKGHRVRQDGYSTALGEVYEFYATDDLLGDAFSAELDEFSKFLDICVEDPESAARIAGGSTLDAHTSRTLVDRYAKEARRLRRDLKYERDARLLSIRRRIETEIEELDEDPDAIDLQALSASIPTEMPLQRLLAGVDVKPVDEAKPVTSIVVNQNIINAANGIFAQEISGNIFHAEEPIALSELISQHSGSHVLELRTALNELEDEDANAADRVTARQKLRTFLFKVADKVSGPTIEVLQKYIESKLGL